MSSEIIEYNAEQFALLQNDSLLMLGNALSTKPRETKDVDLQGTGDIIKYWGLSNNYPQWVLEQIKDVTLIEPILDWKARALYGGGLAYGKIIIDPETGEERYQRIIDNDIEEWLETTDIDYYLRDAAIQFYTFYNLFVEFGQNRTGNEIVYISAKDACDVRLKRKNDKGIVEKAYISPDWESRGAKHKDTLPYDLYNHFHTDLENWKGRPNHRFIQHVASPSPGRAYYHRAPWHNILETWLPIARGIPEFKKALLKNQLTLKYIIKVPEWWWKWKYKDFDTYDSKKRLEIIKKEKEGFENFFKGDKQGNSMMYTQRDSTQAKQFSEWKVEVVDDKLKEGMYIEDSQEADAHIFKNMAVDPVLMGSGAGKDRSGAGSGSDKRVAWNNYMIMTKPHQDLILKPLHFAARWNGWPKRLAAAENEKFGFWFKNFAIAKLDSGAEIADQSNTQQPES